MEQNTQKHMNHTKEEIEVYLKDLKILVSKNKFKISDKNREDNINFIQEYRLTSSKIKQMLLQLDATDFCYSVDNYKNQERLYIFSREYELENWGKYEKVAVYIKINIIDNMNKEYAIIVSFHKRQKNIKFLFK